MFAFNGVSPCFPMASLLQRLVVLLTLTLAVEASLLANRASVDVACDESAMYLQINFTYPLQGIVYTPDNYFNPNCSYAGSPVSTVKELSLTLPRSCGVSIERDSDNKVWASTTLVVSHHRMLESRYDYMLNITCELPSSVEPYSEDTGFAMPEIQSWIAFMLGSQLYPEEVADELGIDSELMLTYVVRSSGMYKDMMVMNCQSHDDMIVDENTNIYQISDPFGCTSDVDSVSNFTVVRDSRTGSSLVAYASLRNISLIVKGKFYITCGALLCKESCERKCSEIDQQRDQLYLNDMATRGMTNRAPGSSVPLTLAMLDDSERRRRSGDTTDLLLSLNAQITPSHELVEKLVKYISKHSKSSSSDSSAKLNEINAATAETERLKRSVDSRETNFLSARLNVFLIKSDADNLKAYDLANINANVTMSNGSSNFSQNFKSLVPSQILSSEYKSARKLNPKFDVTDSDPSIKKTVKTNFSILNCALKSIVIIVALLCLSGACYSVLFVRRQAQTLSVSDYVNSY